MPECDSILETDWIFKCYGIYLIPFEVQRCLVLLKETPLWREEAEGPSVRSYKAMAPTALSQG